MCTAFSSFLSFFFFFLGRYQYEKIKKDLRGSGHLCPFVLHVRCVTASLTEFPDGLKPSAPSRQTNLKQAMRFLPKSAFQGGIVEHSVKEVFGLDSVSLFLMHKAKVSFKRPLTLRGRSKPVKQGLPEYLLSLTKRGASRSYLIIQDLY